MPSVRHPPHRLDLALADWLAGFAALRRRDDRAARAEVESLWAPAGDGLAFLSVRSAFDCALSALDWPPGSEVLVSAVNIREMVDLLRAHRLVPVPLPLDPRTMQPRPQDLVDQTTPRTRGLLLAHLFGARADTGPLFEEARSLGLVCFEDAAQAFCGPGERGDPRADVSLFSFGTIKTATALGGALARVSSPGLREQMAAIQASWLVQSHRAYAGKLATAVLFLALQPPLVYTIFSIACRLIGSDAGAVTRRRSRSFGGLEGAALLRAVRHRPSAPLLAMLRHRLSTFARRSARRLEQRRLWGAEVASAVVVPGADHPVHTHWLIPVLVDDVETARASLRAVGIDASGPSNVVYLGPRPAIMDRLVFVPAYPELPPAARRSLLRALPAGEEAPRAC